MCRRVAHMPQHIPTPLIGIKDNDVRLIRAHDFSVQQ
jgi:hypothetical protein